MKKYCIILFIGLFTQLFSQTATLDSKKIIAAIPEMAKLDTLAAREQQNYIAAINSKIEKAQAQQSLLEEMKKKGAKEAALKTEKDRLEAMAKEIKEYDAESARKFSEYKELLYKPYYEKINASIKKVAESKKLMQVFDVQAIPLAYMNQNADITQEVIKELTQKSN